MTAKHRFTRVVVMIVLGVALQSSAAFAQLQVRVIRDRATIWRRDAPFIVATTVTLGTVLDVVAREGDRWYVVVIPRENGGKGELGLITSSQVEVVGGGPPRADRPTQSPANRPPAAPAQTRRPPPVTRRPVEVFGFGDLGYGSWLAHDTFNAVLGSSKAPMFGGGLQVRFRGLFVEGSGERFRRVGSRVFVSGGDVFNLGIADTVRIIPISATFGYRHAGRHVAPFAGGGIGAYLYKETSDFADPSENLSEHFTGYHVLGGVEFVSRSWLRAALEVQYTTVPNAIGTTGASAAFNERNLGGVHGRLKIMIGK